MLRDELAKRSEWWFEASTRHLNEAVKTVNGEFPMNSPDARRITFVPTPFRTENSYGAKESLVWELNDKLEPRDHMFETRKVTCDLEGLKGLDREVCRRAAAFHPNPAGASKYADEIKKALVEILPTTDWIRN
jgi:hypothetical protein